MHDGMFRVIVGALVPEVFVTDDQVLAFCEGFPFEEPKVSQCAKVLGYEAFNEEYGDADYPIELGELASHHDVASAMTSWKHFATYARTRGVEVGDGKIYLIPTAK